MFWKHKHNNGHNTETGEETSAVKLKEAISKDMMEHQIKQLDATQCLTYNLVESYGGGDRIAIVELDPKNAEKDRRYVLSVDKLVHEKPAGAKVCIKKCDDADEVAGWIKKYIKKI